MARIPSQGIPMAEPLAVDAPSPTFPSSRPTRAFYVFCAVIFLSFLTTSTLSYLSVMLSATGMARADIGMVLGAPLLPVVGGVLFAGKLIGRYGALRVAAAGQVLTLVSFLGMGIVLADPMGATVARFMLGLGFGLLFPAALVYARGLLAGPNTVYWFGIFTSMMPLPNFIGPPLAEWVFARHGSAWFFPLFSVPLVVSMVMMLFVTRDAPPSPAATASGYGHLLRMKSLWLPHAAIIVVGLMWGFMMSFMALFLQGHGVPVAYFFTTATLAMLVSRFTIMGWLGRMPGGRVVAGGLVAMSVAYLVLASTGLGLPAVMLAGVVFGIGYSTAFPVLSLWVADQFPPAARGQPMALFTAMFQGAIFGVPYLVAGMSTFAVGLAQTLVGFALVSLAFATVLGFGSRGSRQA
jgi:MFS family permease